MSFADLELLTKAPSKRNVDQLFVTAFATRSSPPLHPLKIAALCELLNLTEEELDKVLVAARSFIKVATHKQLDEESLSSLLPPPFHPQLQSLIVNIVSHHLGEWTDELTRNQVSLPRLMDFDWRVDVKTASDKSLRMSAPTVVVQMHVQDNVTHANTMPAIKPVALELTRETLHTMLDGLGRIRQQLQSVQ